MTTDLITKAKAGDSEAFRELTEPYRRELQVHCYRMLGPVQPSGLGEAVWLEPFLDSLLEGAINVPLGPDARYETTEAISLAFVTALQRLPARRSRLVRRARIPCRRTSSAKFVSAWESDDLDALVALLTDDVFVSMPPIPFEYESAL